MKTILIIPVFVILVVALLLLFSMPRVIRLKPTDAEDSDGTSPTNIVNKISEGFEDVILKTTPFGYVTVKRWGDIPPGSVIKSVVIHVGWKTDTDRGAGNIFVGYSIDGGESFVETGPFNESGSQQDSSIEITGPFYDMSKIHARWRGEDLDYGLAAIGYVNFTMDVYL